MFVPPTPDVRRLRGPGLPGVETVVRALSDDREQQVVEGILILRLVETLNYVQVTVRSEDESVSVRPSSIEVLRPSDISVEHDEGQSDLAGATQAGLIKPEWTQPGGTWEEMTAALDSAVAALLGAGWAIVDTFAEVSSEHGDSVGYDLRRGDVTIEIEYYCDRDVVAWPAGTNDEESSEPFWRVPGGQVVDRYRSAGWLDTAGPSGRRLV